jgi:hypothetical protein
MRYHTLYVVAAMLFNIPFSEQLFYELKWRASKYYLPMSKLYNSTQLYAEKLM